MLEWADDTSCAVLLSTLARVKSEGLGCPSGREARQIGTRSSARCELSKSWDWMRVSGRACAVSRKQGQGQNPGTHVCPRSRGKASLAKESQQGNQRGGRWASRTCDGLWSGVSDAAGTSSEKGILKYL